VIVKINRVKTIFLLPRALLLYCIYHGKSKKLHTLNGPLLNGSDQWSEPPQKDVQYTEDSVESLGPLDHSCEFLVP
jgi:hypothetical protein